MTAEPTSLLLTCPAKVNLALSVGPPREDGYHPIASWMVAVDFADRLRLTPSNESRYETRFAEDAPAPQEIDWPLEQDLAFRAHRLLEEHVGRTLPTSAELEKHIPAGAGLGGGSSDAAGMLVGLRRLWELDVTAADLVRLAGELGSDVVFLVAAMLGQSSALVTGTGELIEPIPPAGPLELVLIFPPFGCPTAEVYRAFDEQADTIAPADEVRVRQLLQTRPLPADALFNDLARPAEAVQPRLAEARRRVAEAIDRPVHVTGSGAAMFVLTADAEALAEQVRASAGLPAVAAKTLPFGIA
ncbi:MAG: 4-(cytidine 5'-diphospho)-2-C-methyl-D-erythritol kinase [Phycisphaeraceae bacterium]